ncbi:DUF4062 domain-containing protein [Hirschia litorea]|uniref:DUF4062 domain-containing protein n=1 Tax=Hirschia litorea TaxID=1199156 RepID=A0ABW2IN32_9PROT
MSVLIEAITVVVKVDVIDKKLPGGLRAFEAAVPNQTYRSDGLLAAAGFMTPTDVEVFVRSLEREGFRHIRNGAAIDFTVVDQIHGTTSSCTWLDVVIDDKGNKTANLHGAPSLPMAAPKNWSSENKYTFHSVSSDELKVDEETELPYFTDTEGRKLYLGQRFKENDPQARLMLATPRLLDFAKSKVWNALVQRGWQGLDHLCGPDPTHHLSMRFQNQLGLIYIEALWSNNNLTEFDMEHRKRLIDLAEAMRGVPIVARCMLTANIHICGQTHNETEDTNLHFNLEAGDLHIDDPILVSMSLFDARNDRLIAEKDFDLRELIEISDWELLDFAIQIVKSRLKDDGFAIESSTSEANSAPHIVASKNGITHRVIVGPGRYPEAEPIFDQNRLMNAAEETLISGGALIKAPVIFANSEDKFIGEFVRPLFRGEGTLIKNIVFDPVDPVTTFTGRAVNIFISSTFKDFKSERVALSRKALPELQRRASERGVSVSFVDLSWGVPHSDVAVSREVASCLREIASSHPFFIALLGKRYGTLASAASLSNLAPNDAWLKKSSGMSITELEITFSMLKPNTLNSSALVFARSKTKLFSNQRAISVNRRYKPLVSTLNARGYPLELMKNDFVEIAIEKLWTLINKHYPHVPSTDTGQSSARRHRQFAFHSASKMPSNTCEMQAGVLDFVSSWETYATAGLIGLRKRRLDCLVFEHFFALEDAASPLQTFNKRLLDFKQRTTRNVGGSCVNIGSISFTCDILDELNHWCLRSGRKIFLVLAETNRLAREEQSLLALLDENLPDNYTATRVCQSTTKTIFDSADFLTHYLARSGKVLDTEDADILLSHPLGQEVSFLRFAADHLIDAATHSIFERRLNELAEAKTFEHLANVVHARFEQLCEPHDPWRGLLEYGRKRIGTLGPEVIQRLDLNPASYFRVQAALAPMTEHWNDWYELHSGQSWDMLISKLLE